MGKETIFDRARLLGVLARSVRLLTAVLVLGTVASCTTTDGRSREVGKVGQPLTAQGSRVLGFETPLADWSAPTGMLSSQGTASQGVKALGIVPAGWTEVSSIPLQSLGSAKSTASIDVRLPGTPGWGDIHLIVRVPSLGIYWEELGAATLAGRSPGVFHTLQFPVSPSLVAALSGTYDDLQLVVALNGPNLGAPYIVDNIQLADAAAPPPPPDSLVVSLTIPESLPLGAIHLLANDSLTVTDRVTGARSAVSFGPAAVGDSSSVQALVADGDLTAFTNGTEPVIQKAASQTYSGEAGAVGELVDLEEPVPTQTLSWEVLVPSETSPDVSVDPNGFDTASPGRYDLIEVFADATLELAPGTYFVDELEVEPGATLMLSDAAATFIYVFETLDYKGSTTGASGGSTFAVVYLGTDDTVLEQSLGGTLVAPNAFVRLATPQGIPVHRGAVFARELLVSPDVELEWVPPNVLVPQVTDDVQECSRHLGRGGVTGASCSGATYQAEYMAHSTGGYVTGGWNIWTNGYISTQHGFSGGSAEIAVVARGKAANGVWPHMVVRVGGVVVGERDVDTTEWSTYSIPFTTTAGAKEVRVSFTNDYYVPPKDRNLYVDAVSVVCPPSNEPSLSDEVAVARWCNGMDDVCEVEFFAKVGVQRRRSAALLVSRDFTPARYIGVSRDRTQKVRRTRDDEDYACEVRDGDDDEDLVPNSIDQCPNTPPLTPTDEVGCAIALPPGPNADEVDETIKHTGIFFSRECLEGPEPDAPQPLGMTVFQPDTLDFRFSLTQAALSKDCRQRFQVQVQRQSLTDTDENGVPRSDTITFTAADVRLISAIDPEGNVALNGIAHVEQGTGLHVNVLEFLATRPVYARFRVQAINIAGHRSGFSSWSQWYLVEDAP